MTAAVDALPAISILGTRVYIVENPGVVEIMDDWVQTESDVCHQVVNTGMHGIINGHRDPEFKKILNSADLLAPDGLLVILIARLKGFSLRKERKGNELMWDFSKIAEKKGER